MTNDDDGGGDVAASDDPVFLVTTKRPHAGVAVPTIFAAKIMRPRRGEAASLGAPTRRSTTMLSRSLDRRVGCETRRSMRARPSDDERFLVQVDVWLESFFDLLVGRRNRSSGNDKRRSEKHPPHKGHHGFW